MEYGICHENLFVVLLFHFSLLCSIDLCKRRLIIGIMQAPHALIMCK
mgnify:CR=1 FL=1